MGETIHKGHRERMRKRFLEHGLENFEEHEILELLLSFAIPRRDTNRLAHEILNEYKSLANVLDTDAEHLMQINGIGPNSAIFLSMIPHLMRAYEKSKRKRNNLLNSDESIGQYAVNLLHGKSNEEFALICIDSHRYVHWSGIITKGTIDKIETYPRLVMSEVLKHNAKTVIFAHNHPSGSLAPSAADKATTKRLVEMLKEIDVVTLDHIIVSGNRFYSMKNMGFIF